jgi:hypothetical protein
MNLGGGAQPEVFDIGRPHLEFPRCHTAYHTRECLFPSHAVDRITVYKAAPPLAAPVSPH